MRDRSLDIGRGLAILFVYLGHSILYHPIEMVNMWHWCHILERFIVSFNMPLFFIISGYLFSKTKKGTAELYRGKTMRILIPYLFTMAILVAVKLVLPASLSYNPATNGGIKSLIINALFYGGDRWFVYTLYIIFLILIPIRKWLMNKWLDVIIIVGLIGASFLGDLPTLFTMDSVFHYMVFFISGYMLNTLFPKIKDWALNYWWLIYVLNLVLIESLSQIPFVFRYILPFSGSLAVMTLAFQLEKVIEKSRLAKFIEYCGKYSLQFYLFTFCYPIIRVIIVSLLHISNSVLIVLSVFVLQLISITIIVEITRRIKWLKIPCGY